MSYLSRYKAGECVEVWDELTQLEGDFLHEEHYSDAFEVARETMRRVRRNIELIHERLLEMDYRFLQPDRALVPPVPDMAEKMRRLEVLIGGCHSL